MRKLLIIFLLVIALGAFWLWRGRDFSMLVDRFRTIETSTRPGKTIVYEGNGTGGILHVADAALSLNQTQLGDAKPNVGTTKDNQLALSFRGKVFSFGTVSPEGENLTATMPADDAATVSIEHSVLSWPNFFEMNSMTGRTPSWKRHTYQRL